MSKHQIFSEVVYKEALKAYGKKEVPVGAIIVKDNKIIARAHNLRERKQTVVSHAEILAINKASKKLKTWRLEDCSMYVSLEPCAMCAGAIIQSRLKNVYYFSKDLKTGAAGSIIDLFENSINHQTEIILLDDLGKSSELLKQFFRELRVKK